MRELCIEGVAVHGGPESCVGGREIVGEALTGVRVGYRAPKLVAVEVLTSSQLAEGNTAGGVFGSRRVRLAGSKNLCMRGIFMRESREIRRPPARLDGGAARARFRPPEGRCPPSCYRPVNLLRRCYPPNGSLAS
jgi:hypothetical protein